MKTRLHRFRSVYCLEMTATSYARVLLIVHSIFSAEKRNFIQNKAKELDLSGLCKHGFPLGIIAVEGREERVNNYMKQIKVSKHHASQSY